MRSLVLCLHSKTAALPANAPSPVRLMQKVVEALINVNNKNHNLHIFILLYLVWHSYALDKTNDGFERT